jgi:hypothetical protein
MVSTDNSLGRVAVLRYTAVFVGIHLGASALLGGLLLIVAAEFGIVGLPGSHALVLVGAAVLAAWNFIRRHNRIPSPEEFRTLFTTGAVYLVAFDAVLALITSSAYPADVRHFALMGIGVAAIIDVVLLYLALKFPARWIMRGRAKTAKRAADSGG